jgi:hypothetical protein
MLKGSTASSAASASTPATAAVLPFALPVAMRRAIVAARALVVGHWVSRSFLGSCFDRVKRANMRWGRAQSEAG